MKQDLSWFRDHHVENMEHMFAAVSDLYAEYWNDFFHFAIFDGDEDWDAAFARTHRRYADALRIDQASRVLELACGRGGFAAFMAENTQAEVLAVDISRTQLSHAMRHERPNLRFRRHDIMEINEIGDRFDAVAFMDADCYLPDKGEAVAKIAHVMNPGARLLLIAWCKRRSLSRLQEELVLHPLMRYWGIPSFETPSGYRRHFQKADLRLIEEIDLNERVRRNWNFGYERAIAGVRRLSLAKISGFAWKGLALGADGIRLMKDQFHAALYIKAGFDAGFLRYTYFLAEKVH